MKEESPTPLLKSLDNYWFGKGSPTALGIFRMLFGFLLFCDSLMLLREWEVWFTERGYVPVSLAQKWIGTGVPLGFGTGINVPPLNLMSISTDYRFTLAFFAVVIAATFCLTIGLWTRAAGIIVALGMVSLHHRNPIILNGGDTLIRSMAWYIALSPCGQACSIDRLRAIRKGKIDLTPASVSLWTQRLVTYNVALLYLTTVWLKWFGPRWVHGTASSYPARVHEFERFPVPHFINDYPFVYFFNYGTLLVEFCLATLVFHKPLRKPILLAGIAMHAYIEYSSNIPLFSFLITSTYICFYEGAEIDAWAKRVGNRFHKWKVEIQLPEGKQLKPTSQAFLTAVDPFGFVTYTQGKTLQLVAKTESGANLNPAKAAATRSIGLWPIAWIPGVWNKILNNGLEPSTQGAK